MKHHCPTCKAETDSQAHAEFPFCSGRCRLLDLGAWSSEKYRVASAIFDESELDEQSAIQSRTMKSEPDE